ncbi:Hypothetical protein FKW44_018607 [Caligus rogercresseyi]|uniref:Uncharacterized protein n=1 Tax=Caligus rogercresseyi TaxID=217165 RepID=A0A7T8GV21_CALRO|nr:Hypothetical protein FKW44_018607 [Caligus rogercresseyi]
MAELKEAPWKDQWVEEREPRKAVEPVDTPPKVQDIHPTLPPLSSLKSLPKKKKMKKRRAPSTEVPKESRRTSLRGTASAVVILKTRDSDVSVKFWGAGDYTSIKDAGEDRRRSWGRVEPRDLRHVIEAKRRRMSNGLPSINCTTCTEVT